MLFICLQTVVKGFIVGIGRTMETFGIIDLEVVPTGVCKVTGTKFNKSKKIIIPICHLI